MQKIQCKECGYENEPERVYCHNCGIKLDRSLLPKVDKEEVHKKEIKRKKSKATALRARAVVGTVVRTLLYSLLVAGLIRAVFPPDNVPPLKDRVEIDAPSILFDLDDAIRSPSPAKLIYTEDQVNDYLRTAIKGKSAGALADYTEFVRVFGAFEENKVTVTMEQALFGYSFFASSSYAVKLEAGELKTRNLGGSFGRLRVPAQTMRYLDVVFDKVWGILKREGELLSQLRSIGIYDKKVALISKGNTSL